MMTRREYLTVATSACAALALDPKLVIAAASGELITRPIPNTGERLPIIGLGSSASFSAIAGRDDVEAVRGVLRTLVDNGGTVFDTAPSYGASEEVAGRVVQELGIADRVFWATKLNVAGFRGNGPVDPAAARAQVEASFKRLGRDKIDLIQVHNVAAVDAQLPILQEFKDKGRVRYVGTTSTFQPQYAALERYMRTLPLDFIGIDYAVDNLDAEQRIFPLAQERGIAVMVYMPFGRSRLWDRVKGHDVPAWAAEFGAATWAQFFLKFAASHPAVTVVTPATSNAEHALDDMAAARGSLPDDGQRRRMVELIASLPG